MTRMAVHMCVVATVASSALAFQPCASFPALRADRAGFSLGAPPRAPLAAVAAGRRLRAPSALRTSNRAGVSKMAMVEDFASLVEAAASDTTITLPAGTYIVSKPLTIEGKDLYIEAEAGAQHRVIITDSEDADPETYFLEVKSCGVCFDGVVVKKSKGVGARSPAKNAGCVSVLDDGRVTFFNQPKIEFTFE